MLDACPLRSLESARARESAAILVDLIDPDAHVPRFAPVRRAENPGLLELVHDARGAAVADAQLPLQQRGGPALVLDAGDRGLLELGIALSGVRRPLAHPLPRLGVRH